MRNNHRVMDLDLTNNQIEGTIGAEILGEIITEQGNSLKKLNLRKNNLGNAGIDKFANVLKWDTCRIYHLNLGECGFNYIGAKSLYLSVRECHYIRTLILDRNNLEGPTSAGAL